MKGPRVLIVDDEPQILKFLTVALNAAGYDTLPAAAGAEARRLATTQAPDLIVLDLGLPDRDGKDVLRELRQFSGVPVIILSARDREMDKIEALDLGADDYVEKPFGIGELTARLRAALRHKAGVSKPIQRIEIGGVTMDFDKRTVSRASEPIRLTKSCRRSGDRRMSRIHNICASSSDSCGRRLSAIRRAPTSFGRSPAWVTAWPMRTDAGTSAGAERCRTGRR